MSFSSQDDGRRCFCFCHSRFGCQTVLISYCLWSLADVSSQGKVVMEFYCIFVGKSSKNNKGVNKDRNKSAPSLDKKKNTVSDMRLQGLK